MPEPHPYGSAHQKARAEAIDNIRPGTKCFRCHKQIYKTDDLDYDHIISIKQGGANGPKALSHSSCNRRHGQSLGRKSRKYRDFDLLSTDSRTRDLPRW